MVSHWTSLYADLSVLQCYCPCACFFFGINTQQYIQFSTALVGTYPGSWFCLGLLQSLLISPVSLTRFFLASSFPPGWWLIIYFCSHVAVSLCCLGTTGMVCRASDVAHADLLTRAVLTAACSYPWLYKHKPVDANWLHFRLCFVLRLGPYFGCNL